jgi:hypothetical protein
LVRDDSWRTFQYRRVSNEVMWALLPICPKNALT